MDLVMTFMNDFHVHAAKRNSRSWGERFGLWKQKPEII